MMNKELFGVFGDAGAFTELRSRSAFDQVVDCDAATVGIRDVALGIPGRSATYTGDDGTCFLWGEVHLPDGVTAHPAEWVVQRYAAVGDRVFSELNGSYLVFLEHGDEALVATDAARTWDCFYADTPHGRVFGTDPQRVLEAVPSTSVDTRGLLEFVHLGVVIDDRTVFEQLDRVPFDGYLTPESTGTFDRFVYDPVEGTEDEFVDELAARLRRAIDRRSPLPGTTGVLLSGGYDSRALVALDDGVDVAYTLGTVDHPEVETARRIASQYGVDHETLVVTDDYLNTDPSVIKYGMGTRESIHVHHAGCDDDLDVDSIHHGLLFDTIMRGHFLPRDVTEVFGYNFPMGRLDPDPDVTETLASKFGYHPASDHVFPECFSGFDDSIDFFDDVVDEQLAKWDDRYDDVYDSISLLGIQNQPSLPFHYQLADEYIESFVAVDRELLEWHLRTPPEFRNTRVMRKAMSKLDADVLRHRPPDRPRNSFRRNQIEKFLRRKLPLLEPFQSPWPDIEEQYQGRNLDEKLFPAYPSVYDLPVRMKLRINDIATWMNAGIDDDVVTPSDVLCPNSGTAVDL